MSERMLNLMDIRELLLHLRAQSSYRQIQRDTGLDRRTVRRYREWAKEQGLLEGELPGLEDLQGLIESSLQEKAPPQNQSSVEPFRSLVGPWVKQGVEIAAIRQRLLERGYSGSYAAVWRFVRSLKPGREQETTTRLETQPGVEAQVDFGYAGRMIDPESGQLRRAWAFVMTLSWSRHQYAEFVWDQKVETWLSCHRNAFEFFGRVPERVRIDNLRTAILKAVFDEPRVQYAYRECAEHYGFLIAPCRVATPQHHGRAAHPRHDPRETPGALRAGRAGLSPATARQPLRPGRLEARQGVPGLLCGLQQRLLLGAPPTVSRESVDLRGLPASAHLRREAKTGRDAYHH